MFSMMPARYRIITAIAVTMLATLLLVGCGDALKAELPSFGICVAKCASQTIDGISTQQTSTRGVRSPQDRAAEDDLKHRIRKLDAEAQLLQAEMERLGFECHGCGTS